MAEVDAGEERNRRFRTKIVEEKEHERNRGKKFINDDRPRFSRN